MRQLYNYTILVESMESLLQDGNPRTKIEIRDFLCQNSSTTERTIAIALSENVIQKITDLMDTRKVYYCLKGERYIK